MSGDNAVAPVIIKRKKVVGGDGHHGGAWKVAYADFVTAMMAFFMLMWLLNATTETQKKGLADYFSPTIPINRISGGGDGAFGGDSLFAEDVLPQNGTGATSLRTTEMDQSRGASGLESDEGDAGSVSEQLKAIEEVLFGNSGESHVADAALKHIVTRVTDEGLVIELFETHDGELFEQGNEASNLLKGLMGLIAEAAQLVSNALAVEGHVASSPVVLLNDLSWQRSADRAQSGRQLLEANGVSRERISRVTGHADRERVAENPMSPRNNRLEFIFLR